MIFVFLDLFCSFCRILLTKFPQTENRKEQKDHAAGKIAKCPLSFLLLDPPSPIGYNLLRIASLCPDNHCVQLLTALCQTYHIVQLST